MTKPVPAALLLAVCLHWLPAQAQNVYRCGGSYSNQPCPGGAVVPTDDPRSAAQRTAADALTQRAASSARAMEKERIKQEAVPAQATIPAAAPLPAPGASQADRTFSRARPKRHKKTELFAAVAPKKPGDGAAKKSKTANAKTAMPIKGAGKKPVAP